MMKIVRLLLGRGTLSVCFATVLLTTGCTMVGPEYESPEDKANVMSEWGDLDDPQLNDQPLADPKWWKNAFNDPVLDQLIEEALSQNLTLRSAGLRVLQAQQSLAIAMGNQFPQQQALTGSASAKRLSNNAMDHLPLLENEFANYSLGFGLAWEVDFWGQFRRMVQQAAAGLDASVADYDDAMVSLISEVAQTYLMIRTYQRLLDISHDNIALQHKGVEFARARLEAGETSETGLDVFQLLLYNTTAKVAGSELALQQAKNSMATLLGKLPGEIDELLADPAPIPTVSPQIAIGMPQDLIRRRPDVRAAERQLAAQGQQIGIAVADLYPQFSIGGGIGSSTNSTDSKAIGDLFSSDSLTLGLVGSFTWNIFNYDRIKSNIRLQDAVFQEQLVDYRNMVIGVQAEVENAIVAYLKSHEQVEAYRLAEHYAQRATDIAIVQYKEGSADYLPVYLNLWFLYMQQNMLASTQGSVATNLVQVYKSLGGGWQVRSNQDPVALLPVATTDEMRNRTKQWKKVLQ
jgi:NodT family efflux transporter outer membrane factor (OMF) lipoprotein